MHSNVHRLGERSNANNGVATAYVQSTFLLPLPCGQSASIQPFQKTWSPFSRRWRSPSIRAARLLPAITMTSCQTPDTSTSDANVTSDCDSTPLGFDDSHPHPEAYSSSPQRVPVTTRPRAQILKKVARGALLLAGIGAVVALAGPAVTHTSGILSALSQRAVQFGPRRATMLLAVINFFTVLFCFPANMGLMIAAGAVLPATYAFAALFFSKIAAAAAAFLLSRTLLLSRVTRALDKYPRFRSILARSGTDGGWRLVLLMRLSPFPGFVLNYLFGITGVSFAHYITGSVIGIVPSIANLVLIGNTARNVSAGVAADGGVVSWLSIMMKLLAVASMMTATFYVSKAASKAFSASDLDMSVSDVENGVGDSDISLNRAPSTSAVDEPETKYMPLHSQE